MIKLSKKLNNKIQCLLCPNFCSLDKDEQGKCSSRISNGEDIILSTYGEINTMAVEPIEKKPILDFIPLKGSKTLSIGVNSTCSICCLACENFSISQKKSDNSKKIEIKDIISLAQKKNCESICMTYTEPTVSFEFLIDLAKESHKNGLYFILKTNGYINKEPWKEICRYTDIMNIDWKGSEEVFFTFTGAKSHIIRERIKEAYRYGVHVEISIPLFYNSEDIENEMNCVGQFLSLLNKEIPCHLLKVYAAYKHKRTTKDEDIERAKDILSSYVNNISCH